MSSAVGDLRAAVKACSPSLIAAILAACQQNIQMTDLVLAARTEGIRWLALSVKGTEVGDKLEESLHLPVGSDFKLLANKLGEKCFADTLELLDAGTLGQLAHTLDLQLFGLENESAKSELYKRTIVAQLIDEVMIQGFASILQSCKAALLKDLCSQLGLVSRGMKEELIQRLLVNIFSLVQLDNLESNRGRTPRSWKSTHDTAPKPANQSNSKPTQRIALSLLRRNRPCYNEAPNGLSKTNGTSPSASAKSIEPPRKRQKLIGVTT